MTAEGGAALTGNGAVVLESQDKLGRFSVLIDSVTGAPLRILYHKDENDLWDGTPVGSIGPGEADGLWPAQRWKRVDVRIDGMKYEQDRVHPLLTEFVQTVNYEYADGARVETQAKVRFDPIRRVSSPPDAAFAITSPIENGTPVTMRNESGVLYEWRDGEIVQAFDPLAARRHAEFQFRGGFRSPWYFGVVSVLSAFVIALIAVRAIRAARGD